MSFGSVMETSPISSSEGWLFTGVDNVNFFNSPKLSPFRLLEQKDFQLSFFPALRVL